MNAIVIDGDMNQNYGPVWGCLAGWGDENGRWAIELIAEEGYLRFESSKSESVNAVDMAANILRGDNGLQNPNRYIEIKDGVLVVSDSITSTETEMTHNSVEFDKKTIEEIKCYVYALFDPDQPRVPFYIGKGTGNRVFSHANGSDPDLTKEEVRSTKMERIVQIMKHGKVRHVIVQYGLTSTEAYLVESALIDMVNHLLPDTLTNLVSGHGTAENFIDAEDLARVFSAMPIECVGECLLLIKIEKRWSELLQQYGSASQIPPQEIYEATRASWKINVGRAGKVKYVLSVARGLVRAVYKDVQWANDTNHLGRKMFTGCDITGKSTYANHSVAHLFLRGAQTPIRYICCEIDKATNEN